MCTHTHKYLCTVENEQLPACAHKKYRLENVLCTVYMCACVHKIVTSSPQVEIFFQGYSNPVNVYLIKVSPLTTRIFKFYAHQGHIERVKSAGFPTLYSLENGPMNLSIARALPTMTSIYSVKRIF
jgi:hypothetical protein